MTSTIGCRPLLFALFFLLGGACVSEKETPIPAPNLVERNQRLAEVKQRLQALDSADESSALGMLDHIDHRVRRRAVRRLGAIPVSSDSAIEKLTGMLDDPDRNVRIETASALAKIGTDQTLESLVKALVDEDYKVRLWAFKGLVRSKERSVPLLVKHLSAESPYRTLSYTDAVKKRHDIRELLVECLSNIGKPAVPALKGALSNQHLTVRKHIVDILGNIGEDAAEAIHELLEVANSEEEIELRKSALSAIGSIGDVDPEVTPTVMGLTHSDNKVIAQSARNVLKVLEDTARKNKKK